MSDISSPRVGLLGTGIMGGHMVRRLAQAGLSVRAWNRTASKTEPLAGFGVRVAEAPSQALADVDVAIVMLSNGDVVDAVLSRPDGEGAVPLDAMRDGGTLVIMSSVPVELCRDLAARLEPRIHVVDAPVSGGEVGARDGTLAILAGGDPDVVDALAPVFAPLGRATRIGAVGTGQMAKLANQIIVGGTMAAVAEAFHFARTGGADLAKLRDALLGGFGESRILHLHGDRMARNDFVPGSPAMHQLKDMRTAQALAGTLGLRLGVLDTLIELFAGHVDGSSAGMLDVSSIIQEVARRAKASHGQA